MKSAPVFEMRGLCDDTSFDKHFSWTGVWDQKTEHYEFKGFTDSSIRWNEDRKEWRLTLSQDETIYGICNETNGYYPFGMLNWHFFNDTCHGDAFEDSGSLKIVPISFSGECYNNEINVNILLWTTCLLLFMTTQANICTQYPCHESLAKIKKIKNQMKLLS